MDVREGYLRVVRENYFGAFEVSRCVSGLARDAGCFDEGGYGVFEVG